MSSSYTSGSKDTSSNARSRSTNKHDASIIDSSVIYETTYLEDEDPDYIEGQTELLSSTTSSDDEDDEYYSKSTELDSTDSIELDDDETKESYEIQTFLNAFTSQLFESSSTANLLLDTHKRFKNFVHKYEIPRKAFHTSIGFITLFLYTRGVQQPQIATPLAIGLVVVFILDLIRLRWPAFNKLYCKAVGFLMRESEVTSYNGVIWYLLGLTIVFATQKKDITVMSVLLLSWSDTTASAIGRKFGHLTPKIARGKSLAGSIAAFVTGVFAAYLFYGYFVPNYPEVNTYSEFAWSPETSYLNLNTLALLCGFVAAFSEGIDIFNWDDNFTIPVLSSIFLHSTYKLTSKVY